MAITSKSGFWNNAYAFIDGNHPRLRQVSRTLNRRGLRDVKELIEELLGVAPGAAALQQYKRVTEPANNVIGRGGLRTLETVDIINRVTTAADKTMIINRVTNFSPNPTFPVNGDKNPRSLNGG